MASPLPALPGPDDARYAPAALPGECRHKISEASSGAGGTRRDWRSGGDPGNERRPAPDKQFRAADSLTTPGLINANEINLTTVSPANKAGLMYPASRCRWFMRPVLASCRFNPRPEFLHSVAGLGGNRKKLIQLQILLQRQQVARALVAAEAVNLGGHHGKLAPRGPQPFDQLQIALLCA